MGKTIKYEELKSLLGNKDLCLIDVRSSEEVRGGCIPGSIHISLHTVDTALSMTPDDFKIKYGAAKPPLDIPKLVFYCQSGRRGESARDKAGQHGYKNAFNYAGAYSEWSRRERK